MFLHLAISYKEKNYKFMPLWGFLCCPKRETSSNKLKRYIRKKEKLKRNLDVVSNPYNAHIVRGDRSKETRIPSIIRWYAKLLVWLYENFYFGLYLLSRLRLNLYDNSVEATDVFCEIIKGKKQKTLCLPRSIFAATTSKLFSKKGTLFIGVFLPSHHMHAWVIEEDKNSCRYDTKWINFTPVSVMI